MQVETTEGRTGTSNIVNSTTITGTNTGTSTGTNTGTNKTSNTNTGTNKTSNSITNSIANTKQIENDLLTINNDFTTIEHDFLHTKDYFGHLKFSYKERKGKLDFFQNLHLDSINDLSELLSTSKQQLVETKQKYKELNEEIKKQSEELFDLTNKLEEKKIEMREIEKEEKEMEEKCSRYFELDEKIKENENLNEELDEIEKEIKRIYQGMEECEREGRMKEKKERERELEKEKRELENKQKRMTIVNTESFIEDIYYWYKLLEKIMGRVYWRVESFREMETGRGGVNGERRGLSGERRGLSGRGTNGREESDDGNGMGNGKCLIRMTRGEIWKGRESVSERESDYKRESRENVAKRENRENVTERERKGEGENHKENFYNVPSNESPSLRSNESPFLQSLSLQSPSSSPSSPLQSNETVEIQLENGKITELKYSGARKEFEAYRDCAMKFNDIRAIIAFIYLIEDL